MWRWRQSLPAAGTEPAAKAPRFGEEEAQSARPVEPLRHTRTSNILLAWAVAATVVAGAAVFYRGSHGDAPRPSAPVSTQGATGGASAEDSPRPQPNEPSSAPASGATAATQDVTNVEKPATRRRRKGGVRARGAGRGGPRKARLVGVISG